MHWPDPGTLLDVWERGLTQTPQQKVLTLMSAFLPDRSLEEISRLSIGSRDSALLEIFEGIFGPCLNAVTICPDCRTELEVEVAVADIRTSFPVNSGKIRNLSAAGYRLKYRLPTTSDLLAIPPRSDLTDARHILLRRCVSEVRDAISEPIDPSEMPEQISQALAARMARLDPQANVNLSLTCPACGRAFARLLDIAIFVLGHLNAWALRALRDVRDLASAFGWSEAQILSLSPTRREIYLEMAAR